MRLVYNIVLAVVLGAILIILYLVKQPQADDSGAATSPPAVTSDAGIAPLNESQSIRLETATDGSPTVDEAAFYALLENAASWGLSETTDEDMLKPNMRKVLDDPEHYRGELCIIEGKLSSIQPVKTSFDKWNHIKVWYIRMADGDPDPAKLYTNTLVPVYLTDPSAVDIHPTNSGEYSLSRADYDRPVRVIGRFFKVWRTEPVGDLTETRLYPVFVGKRAYFADAKAPDTTGPPLFVPIVFVIIAGYIVLRIVLSRRTKQGYSMVDEQRRLRAERLRDLGEDAAPAEVEMDLPKDPAQALDALKHAHDEDQSDGDR